MKIRNEIWKLKKKNRKKTKAIYKNGKPHWKINKKESSVQQKGNIKRTRKMKIKATLFECNEKMRDVT